MAERETAGREISDVERGLARPDGTSTRTAGTLSDAEWARRAALAEKRAVDAVNQVRTSFTVASLEVAFQRIGALQNEPGVDETRARELVDELKLVARIRSIFLKRALAKAFPGTTEHAQLLNEIGVCMRVDPSIDLAL